MSSPASVVAVSVTESSSVTLSPVNSMTGAMRSMFETSYSAVVSLPLASIALKYTVAFSVTRTGPA